MKRMLIVLMVLGMALAGCANTGRYNTQKGAAIGAGIGALVGQAMGRSTEATLIGAGAGTLLGSVFGNLEDQRAAEARARYSADPVAEAGRGGGYEAPDDQRYAEAAPVDPPARQGRTRYVAPEPQVLTPAAGRMGKSARPLGGARVGARAPEWRPIRP